MEPKPRRGLEHSHALNARCQRCGVPLRRNRYQWVKDEQERWLLVCRDTMGCRLRVKGKPA